MGKAPRTLALAVTTGLVVAACSATPEGPVEPERDSAIELPEQSPAPPERPIIEEPTKTADPPPREEEPARDDPACLVGDWIITEESMQAFYDSMDTPATFVVDGETGLTFRDDGTYEYTPGFTLEIDMGGMIGSGTLTGSIAGSYEAGDAVITTSNENNDIDLTVSVAGTTMDGSELGEGFLMASPINSADFVCTADGPVLTWQGGSGGLDVRLIPAG